MTVLGFDAEHTARAVEVNGDNMKEIQKMLESEGWTNIVFLED